MILPQQIAEESEKPKDTRSLLKKAKNKICKIESTIKQLEEEKELLLSWFESHPSEYSEEKSLRMGELLKSLESAENEWIEVQAQIDGVVG